MNMFNYKGKLVLVTGASSGLGLSLAEGYHASGAAVALVARRVEKLKELAIRLDPTGRAVRYFSVDLSQAESIPSLIQQVVQAFGRPVDVLVHCAGSSCYGEVERIPFEAIAQVTQLNYLAGVRLVQCVVEPMKKRKGGQIVWIGSGSAFRGIPQAAAYSASKAAVKSFCEAVRSELSPFGVDLLLVIPGALRTGFHQAQPNYSSDQRLRSIGNPGDPRLLVRAILEAGQRRRSLLIYGRYAWIGHHLAYWAPALLDRLFQLQLKGER